MTFKTLRDVSKRRIVYHTTESELDRPIRFTTEGWYSMNEKGVYKQNSRATTSRVFIAPMLDTACIISQGLTKLN